MYYNIRDFRELCESLQTTIAMYRESEKNIELEKKILELKAELKNEQERADILNKMLELTKINPAGLTIPSEGLTEKD